MSLDADIPLRLSLQFASHLVHWGSAMPIYPLSETNVYMNSPSADTRRQVGHHRWLKCTFIDTVVQEGCVVGHYLTICSLCRSTKLNMYYFLVWLKPFLLGLHKMKDRIPI